MAEKLKDVLFPEEAVRSFAQALQSVYSPFDAVGFVDAVCDAEWPERALKEKMRHATLCLGRFLPDDYPEALEVLLRIVPLVQGFEAIVLPDFVEVYGQAHWELSLPALGEFTKCGSSEFGIRPFLLKDLEGAMAFMLDWAQHENHHVRRFASEGCRPRLPWAVAIPALKRDPSLILPILEHLKDDPEEYVRRSVANNLNDISKDHPDVVLELCERWFGETKDRDRIVKHACRTLLKQGNMRAMLLFGFAHPEKMAVHEFTLSDFAPLIGQEIELSFELELKTEAAQKVRLEYVVHYMKANGKTSPKVFQIKEATLSPGVHAVQKKHSFLNRTTRKHYAGRHLVEIVVNGVKKACLELELSAEGGGTAGE